MSGSEDAAPKARRVAVAVASVVTGVLLFGAGLAGGWVAGAQTAAPPPDAHGHDHGHSHGPGDPCAAPHAHAPTLSPRTLANLGVEVGELKPSDFVRTRDVPAVVSVRPGTLRPASAPVAGLVEEVLVVEGQRVAAGAPVARVRRDAFPRPSLVLTDAVLRPLNEEFHEAIAALRSSSQALAIAREELARVRGVLARTDGALPTKVEVDLKNEERTALRALENAREEAERHGLTAAEVAAVETGGEHPDFPPAQRVLARNGLWSDDATSVLAALPEDVRKRPYAVAVVAELVGSRALTPRMAEVVRSRTEVAAAFLDVAGLVQQGWTVESLVALADAGALAATVVVRAPAGAPGWDVDAVEVRAGERVEAGAAVAELRDLSHVQLDLAASGTDLAAVSRALSEAEELAAEPLVAGSGPALEGLRLLRIGAGAGAPEPGAAVVTVENRVLSSAKSGDREFRTWAVRPGTRYLVRVPVQRLANRFVLPADAVAVQGPDTVVLLEDGTGFKPVPVRVEHRDARVVVVANDGALFPGDRTVVRGAYSVLLALQAAAGGGVDPHAGHSH
jgi:multidrug efflux pump subunit AcrA (membrane-fusion protein)